ncbi:hypothetical protein QU698_25440, partial [Enterobacter hormaechei subsp. xiangfangensis]
MAMVDRCMSEYDQHGWTVPHLHNNTDFLRTPTFTP